MRRRLRVETTDIKALFITLIVALKVDHLAVLPYLYIRLYSRRPEERRATPPRVRAARKLDQVVVAQPRPHRRKRSAANYD